MRTSNATSVSSIPFGKTERVTDVIVDLDGTLYSSKAGLEFQIRPKVREHASRLTGLDDRSVRMLMVEGRKKYGHGILALRHEYNIDPWEFLEAVYEEIDRSKIEPYPGLQEQLSKLQDQAALHLLTNSNRSHTLEVLRILNLRGCFASINSIEMSDFCLKPHPKAYLNILKRYDLRASRTLVVDDSYLNLETARDLGMHTCLVSNGIAAPPLFWEMHKQEEHAAPSWVDRSTHDIVEFIKTLLPGRDSDEQPN